MEVLPSGDIQAKYQKLAAEYSKLRVHIKVLKKGVLDEQAKSSELKENLKEKEKALRKSELEIDSLTFRNQQLTRRVSVLQDELDALQLKLNKKAKGKNDEKQVSSNTFPPLDSGILQEELQKKIIENAQYASQLSDRVFEVSQLKATLEDYQKQIHDGESKQRCEIAKLKNKNQELQYTLEDITKERNNGTPFKLNMPSTSQATSCNGDILSEGGSLIGSEDALSNLDDLNLNDVTKSQVNDQRLTFDQWRERMSLPTGLQEDFKIQMEYGLLKLENQSLKNEIMQHKSNASLAKGRGERRDSGDCTAFSLAQVDGEGRMVGLLGELEVPFILSDEIQMREERLKQYFSEKLTELKTEKQLLESKTEHYIKECELLNRRFDEMQRDKVWNAQTLQNKHETITRLEDELHTTTTNYEQQMSVLTEHVVTLNDQLASQHDEIQLLKKVHRKK